MVRLWIDVVITVGFGCYFYIINIIITLLRNEGAAIHIDNKDFHPETINQERSENRVCSGSDTLGVLRWTSSL